MAKSKYIPPSLVEFCAQAEAAAQPLTVCRITHPDAIDGDVFEGTYSGYVLESGKTAEALLSDGSFYPPRAVKEPEPVEPEPAAPAAEAPPAE